MKLYLGFGVLFAVVAAQTSCDRASKTAEAVPTVTPSTNASTTELLNDTKLTNALMASQIEDAGDSIVDDAASKKAAKAAVSADLKYERTCTADATTGGATVVVTSSGEASGTTKGGVSFTVSVSGTETRAWTKASTGSAIQCKSATSHIKVDWSDANEMNGLKVVSTVDREKKIVTDIPARRRTAALKVTVTNTVAGVRTVTWGAPTVGTGEITQAKTITVSTSRATSAPDKNGLTRAVVTVVKTKENAPLVVNVTRSTSDQTWTAKTIASGTTVATLDDGGSVESTFDAVKFSAASSKKCMPISGTLTSKVFAKGQTTALHTYVVTFAADGAATVSADGAEADDFDYGGIGCDLEKE